MPEDRRRPEADAGRERDPDGLVHPADLLDGEAQREEVTPAPATGLGEGKAEQSEVAHRVHDLDGQPALPVPLLDVRGDLGGCELPNGPLEGRVLLARHKVHDRSP